MIEKESEVVDLVIRQNYFKENKNVSSTEI